jgi:hypothetical protein
MIAIATLALLCASCSSKDEDRVSSRSYKGHEVDVDSNNFVSVYPHTLGTRLDDCQACHTGGTFTYDRGGGDIRSVFKNSCDTCHLVLWPDDTFIEPQPTTYRETLNPYGIDYMDAGRSKRALREIADQDSDGDSYSNRDEIDDLKYPGDPASMPGQEVAPKVTFTLEQIQALPQHSEFMLMNSHKQQYDTYATYTGVKITDLLAAAGVVPTDAGIEGITVIAPDGYMKDFTVEDINTQFPDSLFYDGLSPAIMGEECGVCQYPDVLPDGITDGGEIPDEQWLMLAWERDGMLMETSNLDVTSGRINGEGPFRIIVPQSTPGSPDRGSNYSPTECGDTWDYDDSKDHNAGAMVRGVVAIKINPLPEGSEDFDHKNGGWAYIDSESVIVYGRGIAAP